jgi:preprotein translocase subunit SecG
MRVLTPLRPGGRQVRPQARTLVPPDRPDRVCYPSTPRDPFASEVPVPLNPFLALAEIVVSIGLMASILLQARGAGLSSAFGGDSAVYRSRRGIEKRLFQFTILLAVLFVVFSIAVFRLVG